MLRLISDAKGLGIAATDGNVGSVEDVYFDDLSWTIRYLVVDTGNWLPGREVLISPMAVRGWGDRLLVNLTRAQVEGSPSIDSQQPVNRRYESEYLRYYGYPNYWDGPHRWGGSPHPGEAVAPASASEETLAAMEGHPNLRSAREVMGYYIEATDGDIGHVEDFLFDDREWAIRYMIVDTGNWWPGKKVLVSPEWVRRVSWADSRVYVDLTTEGVKSAPEYDPSRPLERDYERRLFSHYHRRNYWE